MSEHDNIDRTNMITLEDHPYSSIFPQVFEQSESFISLEDSILTSGQQIPVLLYRGKILDGRRRYLAYTLNYGKPTQFELKTEDFDGTDEQALKLSLDLNNQRRHLSESQRALAAIRLSNIRSGKKTDNDKFAKEVFNVSDTLVRYASFINTSFAPERHKLLQMIERDECTVDLAYKVAKNFPPDQWEEWTKDAKKTNTAIKSIVRDDKEKKLSNNTIAANRKLQEDGIDNQVYGVIYIDPPWKFEVYSEAGLDRGAENHYPTMTLANIREMKIPAAENCVMFMWVTIPHLANGIEVLESWGFTYKTSYAWDKQVPGLGYWNRNQVELLLLGVKGEVPAPTPGQQMPQLISVKKEAHSKKPKEFADGITKMFPLTPKIEMFARTKTYPDDETWFYWGNEIANESDTEEAKEEAKEEFRQDSADTIKPKSRARSKKAKQAGPEKSDFELLEERVEQEKANK